MQCNFTFTFNTFGTRLIMTYALSLCLTKLGVDASFTPSYSWNLKRGIYHKICNKFFVSTSRILNQFPANLFHSFNNPHFLVSHLFYLTLFYYIFSKFNDVYLHLTPLQHFSILVYFLLYVANCFIKVLHFLSQSSI